jgi:hypothetical protein
VQDPADIQRYLTENIVGPPVAVPLGAQDGVQHMPVRGPHVLWFERRMALAGVAVQSLWADPAAAAAGQPLVLDGLRRWRTRLAASLILGWTLAVVAGTAWWLRG